MYGKNPVRVFQKICNNKVNPEGSRKKTIGMIHLNNCSRRKLVSLERCRINWNFVRTVPSFHVKGTIWKLFAQKWGSTRTWILVPWRSRSRQDEKVRLGKSALRDFHLASHICVPQLNGCCEKCLWNEPPICWNYFNHYLRTRRLVWVDSKGEFHKQFISARTYGIRCCRMMTLRTSDKRILRNESMEKSCRRAVLISDFKQY